MMKNALCFRAALALTCLAGMHDACGKVRLPAHLSSNAVLQRDVPVKISGWADPGEPVVVKLGNQVVGQSVGAGPTKQWTVTLPVLKAGPIADITIEGKNSIILSNLLAGDVWVCSGQSNMAMSLLTGPWCSYGGVINAEREVADANHPQIRLFTALGRTRSWTVCSPESAKSFSATGYFFGRDLEQILNVPIGLIQAAVGGVMAEYFTPREARESWPGFAAALEEARRIQSELDPLEEADKRSQEQWLKEIEEAKQKGLPRPPALPIRITPEQKMQLRDARYTALTGNGYDLRIRPLTTQPIKGVIWYQGESNAGTKANYAELLAQLIGGWRHDWNQGDFPFLIMQLANWDFPSAHYWQGKATWAVVRAAQQEVSEKVPNCGMATCIDIGEAKNIHPKNKQEAGHRLALLALKQVYAKDVGASGPILVGTEFEGAKVKLSFHPGGKDQRLVFKKADLSGFELAGKDGAFVPALAEVSGTTLTLSAPSLDSPCSIRYAWADNPVATLFNSAGLPAPPFQQKSKDDSNVQTRTHVKIERRPVDAGTVLQVPLSAQGGQAIRIEPASADKAPPPQLTATNNPAITAPVEKDKQMQSEGPGWRLQQAMITDPTRPRVLMVGDSILNGYMGNVTKALEGKVYVDLWVTPHCHSARFNKMFAEVLACGPYDVVHINLGLHGYQQGRIPEGQYEPLTRALVTVVRQSSPLTKMIWANTTPIMIRDPAKVPRKIDPALNPVIIEQNRLAAKVMGEMNVPVNDFYSLVLDRLNLCIRPNDPFHWSVPEYQILGDVATRSILTALPPTAPAAR